MAATSATMTSFSLLFLLSLPLFGHSAAITTVTIFDLRPTQTPSEFINGFPPAKYSPIGTGSDGLTTYLQEVVPPSEVYQVDTAQPTTTRTDSNGNVHTLYSYTTRTIPVTSSIQPMYATLALGESELKHVQEQTGYSYERICHWGEDGSGECEQKQEVWESGGPTETYFNVYAGATTAADIATFTVSDASSQVQESSTSPTSTSYASRQVSIGTLCFALIFLTSVSLALSNV